MSKIIDFRLIYSDSDNPNRITPSKALAKIADACRSQLLKETHLTPNELIEVFQEYGFDAYPYKEVKDLVKTASDKSRINLELVRLVYDNALKAYKDKILKGTFRPWRKRSEWRLNPPTSIRSDEKSSEFAKAKSAADLRESKRVARIKSIGVELRTQYSVAISEGNLSDAELLALEETLARVPESIWESSKRSVLNRTTDNLYLWAVANGSVVFPYLSLEEAAKHTSTKIEKPVQKDWGLTESGKWRLPRVESAENDSRMWVLIKDILVANYGSENVITDYPMDESVPTLLNAEVTKNPTISTVMLRILELLKAPQTATLRGGKLEEADVVIRNHVDMEIIKLVKKRDADKYTNLSLTGLAISQSCRAEKTQKTEGSGKNQKTFFVNALKGSALAGDLLPYQEKALAKDPENEVFYCFILEILKEVVKTIPSDWNIPKSLFQPASEQLRLGVRRGPAVKTKSGKERINMYVPFSFVKSAECIAMPAITKSKMTEIGADVLKCLDSINKLKIGDSSKAIPTYEKYLRTSYMVADTFRLQWRNYAKIPSDLTLVKKRLVLDVQSMIENDTFSISEIEKIGADIQNIGYNNASTSPEEMVSIKKQISEEITKKKTSHAKKAEEKSSSRP